MAYQSFRTADLFVLSSNAFSVNAKNIAICFREHVLSDKR